MAYLDVCFWCHQVVVIYSGCSYLHREGLASFLTKLVQLEG